MEHLPVARRGLVEPSERQLRVAEIVPGFDVRGLVTNRLAVPCDRLVEAPPMTQRIAQVALRLGIRRKKLRRLLQGVQRVLALHPERDAQGLPGWARIRESADGFEGPGLELEEAPGIGQTGEQPQVGRGRGFLSGALLSAALLEFLAAAAGAGIVSCGRHAGHSTHPARDGYQSDDARRASNQPTSMAKDRPLPTAK